MKSYEIRERAMTDNGCKTVSVAARKKNRGDTNVWCEPCTGDYPCMGCGGFDACIKCGGFKRPSDITNCICNSDNCNTSDIVKPIMPHLAQIFAVFIYSTIFK